MDSDARIRTERDFHDKIATISGHKDSYWGGILFKADCYLYDLLGGSLEGKIILDLGCGYGYHTINLAKKGAIVFAIDLSPGMVQATVKAVGQSGLDNRVRVLEMNAEELGFPDETFDAVFGHSILHHTNLKLTRAQVYRVLKQGGRGVFLEPLGHNPLLNLFRRLTPWSRTPTEKPLKLKDLLFFAEPFSSFHHREFYIIAWTALVLLPFNKWAFQRVLNYLLIIDDILIRHWPVLSRYSWVTVFEVVK